MFSWTDAETTILQGKIEEISFDFYVRAFTFRRADGSTLRSWLVQAQNFLLAMGSKDLKLCERDKVAFVLRNVSPREMEKFSKNALDKGITPMLGECVWEQRTMPTFSSSQVQHKWNLSHELHVPKRRDKRPPTSNSLTPTTRPKCSVCAGVHSWPPEKCRRTAKVERKESPQPSNQPVTQRAAKTNARRTDSSSDSKKGKPIVRVVGKVTKRLTAGNATFDNASNTATLRTPRAFLLNRCHVGDHLRSKHSLSTMGPHNPRRSLQRVGSSPHLALRG